MSQDEAITERTALEVGAEFARAYADGDHERVRELVVANVLERELNPRAISSCAARTRSSPRHASSPATTANRRCSS